MGADAERSLVETQPRSTGAVGAPRPVLEQLAADDLPLDTSPGTCSADCVGRSGSRSGTVARELACRLGRDQRPARSAGEAGQVAHVDQRVDEQRVDAEAAELAR